MQHKHKNTRLQSATTETGAPVKARLSPMPRIKSAMVKVATADPATTPVDATLAAPTEPFLFLAAAPLLSRQAISVWPLPTLLPADDASLRATFAGAEELSADVGMEDAPLPACLFARTGPV